jgi:uncharacterized membrane protein YGL010W
MFAYSSAINSKLEALLAEYSKSHQNKVNVAIHWVFEPLAILAILALSSGLPIPFMGGTPAYSGMVLLELGLLVYYARLSPSLAIVLALFASIFTCLIMLAMAVIPVPVWQVALPLFVVSWVALFLGHRIEGNFPSVFRNPNIVFVGPLWLLAQTSLVQEKID